MKNGLVIGLGILGLVGLIGALIVASALGRTPAEPTLDQINAEVIVLGAARSLWHTHERFAPAGTVEVTSTGRGFWDHILRSTPHCGPDGKHLFEYNNVLTRLGWVHRVTCSGYSQLLYDSGDPDVDAVERSESTREKIKQDSDGFTVYKP
jgi:hypothetical protein